MNKSYRAFQLIALFLLALGFSGCAMNESMLEPNAPGEPAARSVGNPAGSKTEVTPAAAADEVIDPPTQTPEAEPSIMPDTRLAYGETRQGAITADIQRETWLFEGRAGDEVYIAVEATSGDFDAVVDVLTADGRSILAAPLDTYYDEHWQVALPETGTYRLEIAPFRGTRGEYALSLTQGSRKLLEAGETRRGALTAAVPIEVWTVEGVPGESVAVEAVGQDDLDLHLILLGAFRDERLSIVDQSFGAETATVRVPDSGAFQLGIAGHDGHMGTYSVAVDRTGGGPSVTELEIGEIWIATITADDRIAVNGETVWGHAYAFDGRRDQELTFETGSGHGGSTLDSVIELYDEDWNYLVGNDDGGRDLYSYMEVTLPNTGRYYLLVRSFGGGPPTPGDSYDYELLTSASTRSDSGELDPDLPAGNLRSLRSDGDPEPYPIFVTAPPGDVDAGAAGIGRSCLGWTTTAPTLSFYWAGTPAELRVSFLPEEALDATLIIRDPAGIWHCNDDAGFAFNPSLLIQDPPEGEYDVWIGTFGRRAAAGDLVFQEPAAGTSSADPAPVGLQACGLDEGGHGYLSVGDRVVLARHRTIANDANWTEAMDEYVGQTATVTSLEDPDGTGCPGVRVDIDNGAWFWRIRDLRQPG